MLRRLRGGIADFCQELIILIFMLLQIGQCLLTGRIPHLREIRELLQILLRYYSRAGAQQLRMA
ncbi:hypothetical protein D3C81_1975890 [compost metagenome]